eukprot:473339-Ditylum_brightwellii.AAC.1
MKPQDITSMMVGYTTNHINEAEISNNGNEISSEVRERAQHKTSTNNTDKSSKPEDVEGLDAGIEIEAEYETSNETDQDTNEKPAEEAKKELYQMVIGKSSSKPGQDK